MSKPTIYLAGPMGGLTWREASEWRWLCERELKDHWRLISPVRGQSQDQDLDDVIIAQDQNYEGRLPLWHTATGITAMDEFFIDQSDWLLCNFTKAKRVSIGTIWELGYAWANDKKIMTVVEPGSIHDHPFVRRRSHVFTDSLDETIQYFKHGIP